MASWYVGSGYRDLKSYTDQEIKSLIHTMGKRLNQRLSELEKQGLPLSSQAYSIARDWAFVKREGMRSGCYIKPRFRTDVTGRTRKEMANQVLMMMAWERTAASTKTGIVDDWYRDFASVVKKGYIGTFDDFTSEVKRLDEMVGSFRELEAEAREWGEEDD